MVLVTQSSLTHLRQIGQRGFRVMIRQTKDQFFIFKWSVSLSSAQKTEPQFRWNRSYELRTWQKLKEGVTMNSYPSTMVTSMGSTSWAITTSWAFFFSTRVVTVLIPCLTTGVRFVGASAWRNKKFTFSTLINKPYISIIFIIQ